MMKVNSTEKNNLICVASIGKPRGLKGEFFLNSFCTPKENILNYNNFIIQDNKIENFKINYIKKSNSKFYSKIDCINYVDEIKNYTNLKIYIKKEDLPDLIEGEVYWHQLINMKVVDQKSDDVLGKVENLNNFGSNDCLEIVPTDDSVDSNSRLIPFIEKEFIDSIDFKESVIFVNWSKDF